MYRNFNVLIFFILLFYFQIAVGQFEETTFQNKRSPKREFRGVFIASIFNLDWPSNRNDSPKKQQEELQLIFDKLVLYGYNSVVLQVRAECDALYQSKYEPWSYRLTGTQGLAPSPFWDPLHFAVNEAHKRGLEIHAWLNPYRVSQNIKSYPIAKTHLIYKHPDWILSASNDFNLKILNPGVPEVQEYISLVVKDICENYAIDGIHFDDYFYPDNGMKNQDRTTFLKYNPKQIASIEDWRRDNVNVMIEKVYKTIQKINAVQNKNIAFGVSPIGIWKSGIPEGTSGNPSYSALFCDPLAWLKNKTVDYLAPQVYWKINGKRDYKIISKWWNDQIKLSNKHLYLSMDYYRMEDENNWSNTEIINQLNHNRNISMHATYGQIAYRWHSLHKNVKGINDLLKRNDYFFKSIVPSLKGKDSIPANIPLNIRKEGVYLKWDIPKKAIDGDLPKKYVVYAFDNLMEAKNSIEDASKILDIVSGNQYKVSDELIYKKYFVVSSLDKNNNENCSEPIPFHGFFLKENIPNDQLIKKVIITTITGKQIYLLENINKIKFFEMDTIPLKKGLYFCKIILDNNKELNYKYISFF